VAGLVYVAAFAPDDGEGVGQISDGNVPAAVAAGNIVPDSDGYVWIKQDKFHESFCQDLSAEEALVMAVTQKAPVGSTFGDAVSDPAWKKKPSSYQVSTSDRMIHPDTERRLARRMNPQTTIELEPRLTGLATQRDRRHDRPGRNLAHLTDVDLDVTRAWWSLRSLLRSVGWVAVRHASFSPKSSKIKKAERSSLTWPGSMEYGYCAVRVHIVTS
jgi:hypothetical protein